ncbi:hypothetical protein ACFL6Y_11010 [Elusimicrobiota bacterium]
MMKQIIKSAKTIALITVICFELCALFCFAGSQKMRRICLEGPFTWDESAGSYGDMLESIGLNIDISDESALGSPLEAWFLAEILEEAVFSGSDNAISAFLNFKRGIRAPSCPVYFYGRGLETLKKEEKEKGWLKPEALKQEIGKSINEAGSMFFNAIKILRADAPGAVKDLRAKRYIIVRNKHYLLTGKGLHLALFFKKHADNNQISGCASPDADGSDAQNNEESGSGCDDLECCDDKFIVCDNALPEICNRPADMPNDRIKKRCERCDVEYAACQTEIDEQASANEADDMCDKARAQTMLGLMEAVADEEDRLMEQAQERLYNIQHPDE